MHIRKVLVAVDGSEPADRAAEVAGAIARAAGATLTLLYVHDPRALSVLSLETSSADEMGRIQRQRAEEALHRARLAVGGAPPIPEERMTLGRPGEAIPRIAAELKVDLIVVGSRGRSRAAEVLLGSVADSVLRHAGCPVTIVH